MKKSTKKQELKVEAEKAKLIRSLVKEYRQDLREEIQRIKKTSLRKLKKEDHDQWVRDFMDMTDY